MQRFVSRPAAAIAAAALALAPALVFAQEHGGGEAVESGGDVWTRVTWSIVGVLAGGLVLGVLYLLKRRVGGFPRNPDWVAPISVMPSKDFPGDRDPHEAHDEDETGLHGHGGPAAAGAHH